MSSLADPRDGTRDQASRRQRGELLRDGMARIPLDDQIALELAYFEGMSTREIAGVLEILRTRCAAGFRARESSCAPC